MHLVGHLVEGLLDIVTCLGRDLHVVHLVALGKQLCLLRSHASLHDHIGWALLLTFAKHRLDQVKFETHHDLDDVLWSVCIEVLQPKVDRIERVFL